MKQNKAIANRSNKVGIYHYQIAAYAIVKHLFVKKRKNACANKPVLLFFSAHIGDAVIFLDALKAYQALYSEQKGYHLVFACRKEVWLFLEQLGCVGDMEFIEVNRDEILRSYSRFKQAVRDVSRYSYEIYINPRVVSIIEYVFEYCLYAKEKYIVNVEGDISKASRKERFFRDRLDHHITYVPRDMMLLGRIWKLVDELSGTKHTVMVSRLTAEPCELGLPQKYCVFAPSTAETPSKCWPVDRYARLIDAVIEKYDMDVCLSGGKNDRPICELVMARLKHADRIHDCIGKTNFKQWIALIAQSQLVVCNDSSPMHIAASTGTPCVCIGGQWEGSCYYPYVVDSLRPDDRMPVVVLGDKLPCYYCTLSEHGRMSNPDCKTAIEEAEPYPCIKCVAYEDVWAAVTDAVMSSNQNRAEIKD